MSVHTWPESAHLLQGLQRSADLCRVAGGHVPSFTPRSGHRESGAPATLSPGPLGLAAGPVPAEAQSESGSQLRRRCPGQGQTAARADSSARHTPPRPRSCSARRPGRPCAGSLDLGFALGPRPRDGRGLSPSLSPARSHGTGAPVSALAGRVLSVRCPGEPAASSPARPGQRAPDPGRGRGEGDDVRAPVRERHQDPVERPRHPGVLRPQARVPALRLRQIVSGPGAGHGGLGLGRRGPRCRLRSWPQLSVGLRGPRSWKFISKESPQAQRPLWPLPPEPVLGWPCEAVLRLPQASAISAP